MDLQVQQSRLDWSLGELRAVFREISCDQFPLDQDLRYYVTDREINQLHGLLRNFAMTSNTFQLFDLRVEVVGE